MQPLAVYLTLYCSCLSDLTVITIPSAHDIMLSITAAQLALLIGHQWFPSIISKVTISTDAKSVSAEDKKEDSLERNAKTAVKSPEDFSGDISD